MPTKQETLEQLRKEKAKIEAEILALTKVKEIDDESLEKIIVDSVNDIFFKIQTAMNVNEGDFAALYHSGSSIEEKLFMYFRDYANREYKEHS